MLVMSTLCLIIADTRFHIIINMIKTYRKLNPKVEYSFDNIGVCPYLD